MAKEAKLGQTSILVGFMVFIVLPAYNEEDGIEKLLERLIRITKTFIHEYKIIVVNDGSVDHTLQVVKCFQNLLNIEIVSFPKNQGVTAVFQSGFELVCKEGSENDICITMDSDNTHNPFIILDLIEKMEDGWDIVIPSRFIEGGRMIGCPWYRTVLSYSLAFLMSKIANVKNISDYAIFFRAMRVGILKQGLAEHNDRLVDGYGFSGMAGFLVKVSKYTTRITEIPFILRYDLKEGSSGMSIVKSIIGYFVLFKKILKKKVY